MQNKVAPKLEWKKVGWGSSVFASDYAKTFHEMTEMREVPHPSGSLSDRQTLAMSPGVPSPGKKTVPICISTTELVELSLPLMSVRHVIRVSIQWFRNNVC